MPRSPFIKFIEYHFSRHLPPADWPSRPPGPARGLPNGTTVVVIGGGIAGSTFARLLLMLCKKEQKKVNLHLVNSTGCNYCGGLITNLALETMGSFYHLDMPDNLVLKSLQGCIYVNTKGSTKVRLARLLLSTLRTSRFGIPGFDDSLRERICQGIGEIPGSFHIYQPTVAKRVLPPGMSPDGRWRVVLSKRYPDNSPVEISADLVVIASGFNSLNKPMLNRFQATTGYVPPPVLEASVTEVDTSSARYNRLGDYIFMLDGIVPGTVAAFIPKGKEWLTLTCLNKAFTTDDLLKLFAHPSVKEYIDLPDPVGSLRCHIICPTNVFLSNAKNFYGDGYVILGDLSGYGRVFKDGYFAAFWGAWLAAHTVVYHGISKQSFARYYHHPLRKFERDNRVGVFLFNLDNWLKKRSWFNCLIMSAAQDEAVNNNYGWTIHAAIRALTTGRLSYTLICFLFITGIFRFIFRHPIKTLKCFWK